MFGAVLEYSVDSTCAETVPSYAKYMFVENAVCGGSSRFDFLWGDGAFGKRGHNNQGIYIDPARECVGVYFSASAPPNYPIGYMRAAALSLDGASKTR